MADITMCDNQKCPIRSKCYRAMATPSYIQSRAIFKPDSTGVCSDFVEFVEHTRKPETGSPF